MTKVEEMKKKRKRLEKEEVTRIRRSHHTKQPRHFVCMAWFSSRSLVLRWCAKVDGLRYVQLQNASRLICVYILPTLSFVIFSAILAFSVTLNKNEKYILIHN